MAQQLALDEVSNRIIDAILELPHISRENLHNIIRPNIKAWMKPDNAPNANKTSKDRLLITIQSRELQQKFWLAKVRALVGEENMQPYYQELDVLMMDKGFKK